VYYIHRSAHKNYRKLLVDSRSGVNISAEELMHLDAFVSPLIRQGQSIHHITVNNPDEFTVSKKSLYRYVAGGLLQARNIDMPRICRLRPRKSKPILHKVDPRCRIDRTYQDFKSFMELHNAPAVVEMDSVIGRIGGKVLLTLMFKSCDFMLAFLRDHNTSKSVIEVFASLYRLLGYGLFCQLFPLLLTDNGSEFSNPSALEFDTDGRRRTYVFYCDPNASFQKPNVELNHEFIRKILPKGSSFNGLTQSDINLMMSHINSYSREKLGDKSPNKVFTFLYNLSPEIFGIQNIPANEIILTPSLPKKQKQ
jgi:IS30 family transposase